MTVTAYAAANAATSNHTSTWGCQLGKAKAKLMPSSSAEDVQRCQHDQVEGDRGDDPQHEEPTEDRLVRAQVHVPRGDHRELGRHGDEQEHDDQTVGDVALEVIQP